VAQYGPIDAPVLITGETGTGKELVARGLHEASARRRGPFVAVNCAAIPTALFESEVFGSVKGAYTGALSSREGLVGTARGGTLFLDEVAELPFEAQGKLLRLLEGRTYRPVGAAGERTSAARVVAATNRIVDPARAEGALRGDLYYRLAVLHIHIAPLRERRGDIAALVAHFIGRHRQGAAPGRPTPEAIASLMAHNWPGNVRELEHTIARTLTHSGTGAITRFDLGHAQCPAEAGGAGERLDRERIARLLAFYGGHLAPVARELGTSVRTVQRRLKDLRLCREDFRALRAGASQTTVL
jgi:transcriptional regulator with PAS, ATPase and Fis domain